MNSLGGSMSTFLDFYKKAYEELKNNNFEEALNSLDKAEELYDDKENVSELNYEDVLILKATIKFAIEDIDSAETIFKKALEKNPQSSEACIGLAKVFITKNQLAEAKHMYEWALKFDPQNEVAEQSLKKLNDLVEAAEQSIEEETEQKSFEEEVNLQKLFDEAYDKYLNDDFDDTLNLIDNLENVFEEEINILKGNTYLSLDHLDKAKEAFENVLKNNKKSSEACNGLAEMFLKKGMVEDAKVMYECALDINSEDQFALMGLAKVNQELGLSPIHSKTGYSLSEEINNELNDKLEKAYQLYTEKNYNESMDLLNSLEQTLSNSSDPKKDDILISIYNFKGFNNLALNEIDSAEANFEKSLSLNANSSQACAGLGEVYFLREDDEKSKIMFEWGVKNNRKNLFAVSGLAKVNKNLNLEPEHNSLDLGVDKEHSEEFNKLLMDSYDLFDKKEYENALANLNKAERLIDKESTKDQSRKSLSSVLNFKGFCYLGLKDFDKAKGFFEESLKFNPKSSQACAGLGELFYLSEQDREAKRMFEWALRNEPLNEFAKAGLVKVNKSLGLDENDNTLIHGDTEEISNEINKLIEEGYGFYEAKKFDEALKNLDKAEALLHKHFTPQESVKTLASLNNFKGFNYLALRQNSNAKSAFENSLELEPESSQASAGLGELFYLEKKDNEAKEMFEWALVHNPNNKFAESGLQKVNTALGFEKDHNSKLVEME